MPIHAPFGGFWAHFPQMMSLIVLTPKRTILGRNHIIWAINRENRSRGSSWALEREKKRTRKKSQRGHISPICGEAPTEAMFMKICLVGDVLGIITCAKFQKEIFRGYDFTGGRIFHFPIDFWMGLTTVQRYCAACDLSSHEWPFKLISAVHNFSKVCNLWPKHLTSTITSRAWTTTNGHLNIYLSTSKIITYAKWCCTWVWPHTPVRLKSIFLDLHLDVYWVIENVDLDIYNTPVGSS